MGAFADPVCRRRDILLLFAEAEGRARPPKLRRRFPLFDVRKWRIAVVWVRRCKFCAEPVRRVGERGPLAIHCSPRCAKRGYDFSPRKAESRRVWQRAYRARARAASPGVVTR